jgi:hypothetical protein
MGNHPQMAQRFRLVKVQWIVPRADPACEARLDGGSATWVASVSENPKRTGSDQSCRMRREGYGKGRQSVLR